MYIIYIVFQVMYKLQILCWWVSLNTIVQQMMVWEVEKNLGEVQQSSSRPPWKVRA
jgi:hypothetical protein